MACSFTSFDIFDAELTTPAGILVFSLRQCYVVLQCLLVMLDRYLFVQSATNLVPLKIMWGSCRGGSISSTEDIIIQASVFQTYEHTLWGCSEGEKG